MTDKVIFLFLRYTHESENVFLIAVEPSSISVKDKNIQGPLLVCKTMQHIISPCLISNCKWGRNEKYAKDYRVKQFGSA